MALAKEEYEVFKKNLVLAGDVLIIAGLACLGGWALRVRRRTWADAMVEASPQDEGDDPAEEYYSA